MFCQACCTHGRKVYDHPAQQQLLSLVCKHCCRRLGCLSNMLSLYLVAGLMHGATLQTSTQMALRWYPRCDTQKCGVGSASAALLSTSACFLRSVDTLSAVHAATYWRACYVVGMMALQQYRRH
jgi:hypothetical protein